MKAICYLHSSREAMYNKGIELGLSGEALDYFSFGLYEVKVEIEVDESTGKVTILAIDGKKVW